MLPRHYWLYMIKGLFFWKHCKSFFVLHTYRFDLCVSDYRCGFERKLSSCCLKLMCFHLFGVASEKSNALCDRWMKILVQGRVHLLITTCSPLLGRRGGKQMLEFRCSPGLTCISATCNEKCLCVPTVKLCEGKRMDNIGQHDKTANILFLPLKYYFLLRIKRKCY